MPLACITCLTASTASAVAAVPLVLGALILCRRSIKKALPDTRTGRSAKPDKAAK